MYVCSVYIWRVFYQYSSLLVQVYQVRERETLIGFGHHLVPVIVALRGRERVGERVQEDGPRRKVLAHQNKIVTQFQIVDINRLNQYFFV